MVTMEGFPKWEVIFLSLAKVHYFIRKSIFNPTANISHRAKMHYFFKNIFFYNPKHASGKLSI